MNNTDKLTSRQAMAAFLFPPVGLINYFRKKESEPKAANASAKIALFSAALYAIGAVSNVVTKKQNLKGFENKAYEANWLSSFITIPDMKVKVKVPYGPKSNIKVFVEIIDGEFIITDENGMIINF